MMKTSDLTQHSFDSSHVLHGTLGMVGGLILAATLILISATAHADELTLKSKENWNQLFATCESSWEKYDADLARLRISVKRDVDKMTREEYLQRWKDKDPTIRFVRLHWPSLFAPVDGGWEFYQACADHNWKVRKALGSAAATKAEKLSEVKGLENCIDSIFPGVPFPFDRIITCYTKQAGR